MCSSSDSECFMHSSNDLLSTNVSVLCIHLTCQVLTRVFYIFIYDCEYFMYSSNDLLSTYVSVLSIHLTCQVLA